MQCHSNRLSWTALKHRVDSNMTKFLREIAEGEVFVIKTFLSKAQVEDLRSQLFAFRAQHAPGWHPNLDGCPDYHRINDGYDGSRVKGRFRVFHFHRWNGLAALFEPFRQIFELKCQLAGQTLGSCWDNRPSQLLVPRLTVNHYPPGGSYISEHVDPSGDFARIQTLVQLSSVGREFHEGGLYFRPTPESPEAFLDPTTTAGDLLILSPAKPHGVHPVDPRPTGIDWESKAGRLIAIPIITHSDYVEDESVRSRMVADHPRNKR